MFRGLKSGGGRSFSFQRLILVSVRWIIFENNLVYFETVRLVLNRLQKGGFQVVSMFFFVYVTRYLRQLLTYFDDSFTGVL